MVSRLHTLLEPIKPVPKYLKKLASQKVTAHPIQTYIPHLEFTSRDLTAISQGLTNNTLTINTQPYQTALLRQLGKQTLLFRLYTSTIFSGQRYLASSPYEIKNDLGYFTNDWVIPQVMRRNGIYDCCVVDDRLVTTERIEYERYLNKVKEVKDKTAIGSLFTLIGLVKVKYGDKEAKQVCDKLVEGKRGIIEIVQEEMK
ncbi:uncharacterized protein SPAPADRAFT_65120 [Spathaspora passalidarum NRRL Y-27907]|uniref:RNase III domain-containing protein n=1 Tax=Spathaspora passalidarum (strain NRRL Y-27907 / 11-Y1) TaxID=619300 RepID=G3AJL5_SPAPN|nr:uncharacterized protein SPAPADRAFT_65120 [Spathaspora passalidarum NRRL Y-27907]EGW33916.1 hypothetical protein SPAPADRAFT_65120 [Spathaspora passalidarum NRRL Y-27907]